MIEVTRRLAIRSVHPGGDLGPALGHLADIAPRFEVVDPSSVVVAAIGPSRYFGGDSAVAERIIDLMAGHGFPCGVGVADGHLAATVAALQSVHTARRRTARDANEHRVPEPIVVPPGGSARYLAPLSIGRFGEFAGLPGEFVSVMVRLGITTCGQLAGLPAEHLLNRFGHMGAEAHRLASGHDRYPLVTAVPTPDRSVHTVFDQPVMQTDPVVFAARQLAHPLTDSLSAEGRVCTRLTVVIETDHGERSERSWYLDEGFGAVAVVQRVRWQLDAWVALPGAVTAGVVLLRLIPDEVRARHGSQIGFWGQRSQADDDATRAIARLGVLAGEEAVRVPVWEGGRLAHERYRLVPAASIAPADQPSPPAVRHLEAWRGALAAPSPALLHGDPQPIEVVDDDGAAVVVTGRGELSAVPHRMVVHGRSSEIVDWAGPWIIDQRWWSPGRHRRLAQMQVIDGSQAAHLLWRREQRWWLAAAYA